MGGTSDGDDSYECNHIDNGRNEISGMRIVIYL